MTRIWVVPSLLRALLEDVPDLQQRLPALRFWVTTGEALTTELLRLFRRQMPDCALYNLYGTSEVWDATWYETGADDEESIRVPIGFAIDNVSCYVLDGHMELTPVGVPGELYIGGAGVARAYQRQPALTAAKFLPDPFSSDPGSRVYRSGDLARWREDGAIEFVGRIDHQIKLRGYRLEPGEIEALLEQHPDVAKAVVIPAQDGGETRLRAFYVCRGEHRPSTAELRAFVRKRGQEHLVPHRFYALDSLPLLPNGKLDRRTLTAMTPEEETEPAHSTTAPQSSVEQRIAAVWRDVLGTERIGIDENFFDLGGHSLSMMKVHRRLVSELGVNLSIIDLFRYPTIHSLVSMLERQGPEALKASSHAN